jgi:hypothetical protein
MCENRTFPAGREQASTDPSSELRRPAPPLKGAAAAVLGVLRASGGYARRYELMAWTGYGAHSVSSAIGRLTGLGLIAARTSRGPWCAVSAQDVQLPDAAPSSVRISRNSPLPSSCSPSIVESSQDREEEEQRGADFARSHRALLQAGIFEPAASELARLPYVNPEYIAAHVEAALNLKWGLGTAIYRMRYGWSAPPRIGVRRKEEDPVIQRQREVEAKIRKFREPDDP